MVRKGVQERTQTRASTCNDRNDYFYEFSILRLYDMYERIAPYDTLRIPYFDKSARASCLARFL